MTKKKDEPKYWIFKCNPNKYDIDGRMANPDAETSWRVTRYENEMRVGDTVFIWRCGPIQQRGIVAIMNIESNPQQMEEIELERKYIKDNNVSTMCRVKGRFMGRFFNIPCTDLMKIPELSNLSVFHGFQQATNYRVTLNEGGWIMKMICEHLKGGKL